MHSLTAAGVLRHYGDSRFCEYIETRERDIINVNSCVTSSTLDKTPCLKALLVGVSACSIFYRLLAARATSPRVSVNLY